MGQFLTTIFNAILLHKKSIRVTWRLQTIFKRLNFYGVCRQFLTQHFLLQRVNTLYWQYTQKYIFMYYTTGLPATNSPREADVKEIESSH